MLSNASQLRDHPEVLRAEIDGLGRAPIPQRTLARLIGILEGVEQILTMEGLKRHVEVFQARRNAVY